jgi:hypothetical protein
MKVIQAAMRGVHDFKRSNLGVKTRNSNGLSAFYVEKPGAVA